MNQIVVFPHQSFWTNFYTTTINALPPNLFIGSSSIPLKRLYELIKQVLEQFAEMVLRQSALSLFRFNTIARDTPLSKYYRVLEGIGAIVFDDSVVDRFLLDRILRASIFDNILVPLISPIERGEVDPDDLVENQGWHLDQINISAARQKNLRGRNVLVGMLDTGIDVGHTEFQDKKIYFQRFNLNGEKVITNPHDASNHGTHVAGLIAGKTVGVAPDAELAVAAVLTEPTSSRRYSGSLVQILSGLSWLTTELFDPAFPETPGVDVINISFGMERQTLYFYQAIASCRAITGTLTIAAIGNTGRFGRNLCDVPGSYDLVMGVGGMKKNQNVMARSDWGKATGNDELQKPDLCAPGAGLISSIPGNRYQLMSGTSMASPIVCGTAALLLEQEPTLTYDATRLQAKLLALTSPFSDPDSVKRGGRGMLDLSNI
ncbi:MAG: S8/S53 family peptidase [Acidobacteria bacterium]|nr:S8/S53 family peptidase [Acidobacteriota bacterium]